MKGKWKRLLAAMLAASMIFGNAVPAYATESEPIVEVVEAETEVTEEDTVLEDGLDDTSIEIIEETVSETVEEAIEETVEEPIENVTENMAEPEADLENVEEGEPEEILIQETVTEVSTVNTYNSSEYLHEVSTEYWRVYNRTDEDSHFLIVELKDAVKADIDWLIAGIDECKKFMANEVEKRGVDYTSLRIEVQYDNFTGSKVVPVSLWNAAAAYGVAAASQNFSTWFFFGNRNDIQYKWVFEDIQKITDGSTNVNMEMSVNIDSDSTTVTMPDISFNCSDAITLFCVYSTRTEAVYENFVEQYGTKDAEVEIWKEGSSEPQKNTASYDYEDGSAEVNLGWVSKYTKGNYTLKKQEPVEEEDYTGTIIEGGKGLLIDCDKLSDVANFESAVEKILKARAEDTTTKFRRIEINYPVITGSISASLWNAAVALLDPLEPDEDTELYVNFYNNERTNHNWRFVNPSKVSSTNAIDTGIDLEFYKEEIDGHEKVTEITLKFDKTNYAAERAFIGFYTNNDRHYSTSNGFKDDFTDFAQYFGNSTGEVLLINESTQTSQVGWYEVDNSGEPRGFWLDGFNAKKLTAGVKYSVEKKIYTGSVQREDGQKVLYVRHWETDPFDDDVILDALQARIDAGEDFAQVIISYPENYSTTIPKEIWNAVEQLMNNDEWSAGFLFDGGDYMDKNWYVAGMETATEDVVLDANMTVGGDDILGTVTFTDTKDIPAENVHIRFCSFHWYDEENGEGGKEDYALFVNTFGTNNYSIDLYDANQELLEDTSARYEYYSNGPGNDSLEVCFDHINRYENGSYTFVKKIYAGRVENWDGERVLAFYPYDFYENELEFSEDVINEILATRTLRSDKFDRVVITYPRRYKFTGANWNPAIDCLDLNSEIYSIQIQFADDVTYSETWYFKNPEKSDNNINLSNRFVIGTAGKFGKVSFENTDYPAEYVEVTYTSCKNDYFTMSDYKKFAAAFGNKYLELNLVAADGKGMLDSDVCYGVNEQNMGYKESVLSVRNLGDLEANETYSIAYCGERHVDDENNWSSLFLSSFALGKNRLTDAEVKVALEFYAKNGMKFDVIEFEQANTTSNIIDKDFINLAANILKDSDETEKRVSFIFCDCEEVEENNWIQNDLVWHFRNPGTASKDINGTIAMSAKENQGVTFKLSANTYNAENVWVNYTTTEGSTLAEKFHSALTIESDKRLLKKSIEVMKYSDVGFYYCGENDECVELFIGNIPNMDGGTEYFITDVQFLNNPEDENDYFVIGGEAPDIELRQQVDEKTTVTWTSHSPEKTEVTSDGKIKFINAGGDHFISAKYKSGGKDVFELFWARAEAQMTGLAFEKEIYDLEFWPDQVEDEWANRGYLNVRYYPSDTWIEQEKLTWYISTGDDVVEFVHEFDEEGNEIITGEIRGLKEGTATVTVTHPENSELTDTIVVKVVEAANYIPDEAWSDAELGWLYAFANTDKTLADIKFPEDSHWRWANEKQSLKNYYDAPYGTFEAIYTKESGVEVRSYLDVEMVKLEAVYARALYVENDKFIGVEPPTTIQTDERIELAFDWKISRPCNCDDGHDGCGNAIVIDTIFGANKRFSIVWSDNLSDVDENCLVWNGENWNYEDVRMFETSTKGTYKFNVSLVDNRTSKTILKANCSLKVVDKQVDFERMIVEGSVNEGEWNKGTLHFMLPVDEYAKISSAKTPITVKSSDTKVFSVGKPSVADEYAIREVDGEEITYVDTFVTYEEKNPGRAVMTITAADDAKSTWFENVEVIEKDPKILQPTVELNKAYMEKAAEVTIQFADNFPYPETSEAIEVIGASVGKFSYECENYDSTYGQMNGKLVLVDSKLKNGTYTVGLRIPLDRSFVEDNIGYYETTVKVKVTDKAPTVKIKQTQNVNLFYNNQSDTMEGAGVLTIDIGKLEGMYPPYIVGEDGTEDFSLDIVDGEFRLIYTPNDDNTVDKEVQIGMYLNDIVHGPIEVIQKVKVKTEDKAPTLVMSTKMDTLYPKQGTNSVDLYLKDKTSDERICFEDVSVVLNKKSGETISLENGIDWDKLDELPGFTMSKNKVYIGHETDEYTKLTFFVLDENKIVDSSEKFTFSVRKENWSKPLSFAYTLKVATKAPKLVLGSSKLTLNMNEEIRNEQVVATKLTLANCSASFDGDIYFTGTDANSKKVLGKGLSLYYDQGRREIIARLNSSYAKEYQIAKGTYSFKVWVNNESYNSSTTFKITIVDIAPEKCIKLSKKGSIDLLMKDTTSIEFTPKLSNLDGTIVDACVEDSDWFYGSYEDGKLVIRADGWPEYFNTKHNYTVTPVFKIRNSDGGEYDVRGAAQIVKVTQSKPKVIVNSYMGNTLYTLAGNSLPLWFDAMVKNTDIEIRDVQLLNYTEDLNFWYNNETGWGELSRNMQSKQITTNGKTWALKFAVTFVDGAGNEKPVTVTYKVTIK